MSKLQKKESALSQDLKSLLESARKIAENTRSPATRKAYETDFRQFRVWCESMGFEPFPAGQETLALYAVALDRAGKKTSTIRRALTSISKMHELAGLENPYGPRVKEIGKGIARTRGVASAKKRPITLDILTRLIAHLPHDFIGIRNKAILLVGWSGALRRSELVRIDAEHIQPMAEGISITIIRSKTDQTGKGREIGLPFVDNYPDLCAARALQQWMSRAQIAKGAVFRSIKKGGRGKLHSKVYGRLSRRQVARIVQGVIDVSGYNPLEFGAHSLRSGLATSLAHAGIEEREIMGITGHRSLKILREYIAKGALFVDHPIIRMFQDEQINR